SRTVTRVRLRGTSLSSPAATAFDTLIRLIGNASPDANKAEYFMKSRRVGGEPQDWLSIPSGVRRFRGTCQTSKGRKSYLVPLAAKGRFWSALPSEVTLHFKSSTAYPRSRYYNPFPWVALLLRRQRGLARLAPAHYDQLHFRSAIPIA